MKFNIKFLKYRFAAYIFSFLLLAAFATGTYLKGGLTWGIDFVGGVKLTVQFPVKVSTDEIIKNLSSAGIASSVQQIGLEDKNEYVISTKLLSKSQSSDESFEKIWAVLSVKYPGLVKLGVETVGPSIGEYLKNSAFKLILLSIIMMTIYLAFRFDFKFSLGAMAALIHDVTISVFLCGILGIEINTPILAAILFIFGYSVNDTIVIFDRIRETVNLKNAHAFVDIIDTSISATLSRTMLTSFTTLIGSAVLFFFGGESIRDFAFVISFGIIIGTYSSIFVASPVVNAYSKLVQKRH